MKVALCLHGLFDSATDKTSKGYDGYKHIKNNILDVVDTDVFIHSWELDKEKEICDLYNPVSYLFQEQKDFSSIVEDRNLNTLKGCPRPPQSVLSHLYSVSQSIKRVFEYNENYDIVVKARFDLGRINRNTSGPGKNNPYPVQCINFKTDIENDKIYMANWNHFKMGPADMWFYGSPEIMKNFCTLYESLKDNMIIDGDFHEFARNIEGSDGDLSNAIAFYKWWMINNGLWNNRVNLKTVWE